MQDTRDKIRHGNPAKQWIEKESAATYCRKWRWLSRSTSVVTLFFGLFGIALLHDAYLRWHEGGTARFALVAGAVPVLYGVLALMINRTIIRVSRDFLEVRRGPLWVPFVDQYLLRSDQIDATQLRARRHGGYFGTSTSYDLVILSSDGKILDLLNLPQKDEARRIRTFITETLGLRRNPDGVPGEDDPWDVSETDPPD